MKTKAPKTALPPLNNSVDGFCYRLGICRGTFYKAVAAGKIKTVKLGTRTTITEEETQRVAREGF